MVTKSSYFKYWGVNNLYGQTISRKLAVNDFKQVDEVSQFDEKFIKSYNEESDEEYFCEVDVQYHNKLHNLHNDLPF